MSTSTACVLAIQGHPDFFADDYVTEPLDYSGGRLAVSPDPGLGLELDPDKVTRYGAKFEEEGMGSTYPISADAPVISIPAF